MDCSKDYYSILGVESSASDEEISAAYKKQMKKWHPDLFASKSKDEQDEATRHSSEINEAYDVLSDAKKRKEYDMAKSGRGRFGPAPFGGMGGAADEMFRHMHDMHGFWQSSEFNFMRPKPERNATEGASIFKTVELPFEDFFFGCRKTCSLGVLKRCDHCNGGIIGDAEDWTICDLCHGSGMEEFIYGGNFMRRTCRKCGGCGSVLANVCTYCSGSGIDSNERRLQTVEFVIPEHTNGLCWTQIYRGVGHAGAYGGANGDITITATASKSGIFFPNIVPQELCTIHYVNIFKAMSGGIETILTPYGTKTVILPSGLKDGQSIRYGGAGLKGLRGGDGSTYDGDLHVIFKYELPSNLDEGDLKRLGELADIYSGKPSKFVNISAQSDRDKEYLNRLAT